jgi:hypothetical protein
MVMDSVSVHREQETNPAQTARSVGMSNLYFIVLKFSWFYRQISRLRFAPLEMTSGRPE